jgi:hypothetical protein
LKAQSDKNKAKITDPKKGNEELFKDFDAILAEPLTSEKDRAAYKPKMSEAEAQAYVKGSATEKLKLYHGGSDGALASISGGGAKMGANTTGLYGGGFYMASDTTTARDYAKNNGGKDILQMHTKLNNPLVYDNAIDYFDESMTKLATLSDQSRAEVLGGRFGSSISAHHTALAKLMGHDGIFIKNKGYAVAFEKEQVVTSGTADRKTRSNNIASHKKLLKTKTLA